MDRRWFVAAGAALLVLTGCSSTPPEEDSDGGPDGPVDLSEIPDAVPRVEPHSRYGNPVSYRVQGRTYRTLRDSRGYREQGIASWYGTKFHGKRTSSGEPYDMFAMSAAHKTLPLPTYARVTNLANGRSVVVKINDRGPFHPNRIIDLSYAAAARLEMHEQGTAVVEVQALDPNEATALNGAAGSAAPQPSLWLQVGAFGSRDNAERLRQRLEQTLTRSIRVQDGSADGQPVYRVQVGPLETVTSSDQVNLQLSELGFSGLRLVVD